MDAAANLGPLDPDFFERILLPDAELLKPDQLEQREKSHHDFGAARRIRKTFLETHRNTLGDDAKQKVDLVGNREVLLKNLAQVLVSACFPDA